MSDLSVIFYTACKLEAARPRFAKAIRDQLVRSVAGEFPIICVSHEPVPDFGDHNIVIGPTERGTLQIYRNALAGIRAATAPYVALVEDDVAYHESHFRTHRPAPDRFAYNMNRWSIYTWHKPPYFSYKCRIVLNQLIAPRQLLIDCLEYRFAQHAIQEVDLKWWGEPGKYDKKFGQSRKWEPFASPVPQVMFSHEEAFGYLGLGNRKAPGESPRIELPYWGSAQGMIDLWNAQ